MSYNALGGYGRHVLVGLVDALPAFEPQRESDRIGEIFGIGRREVVGVGHDRTIARAGERNKNIVESKEPRANRALPLMGLVGSLQRLNQARNR
jgi:hypothetical protein